MNKDEEKIVLTEEEEKEQEELKRKAKEQEELLKIVNNTEIKFYREKDIPKTESGISSKAKELLDKYKEKLKK